METDSTPKSKHHGKKDFHLTTEQETAILAACTKAGPQNPPTLGDLCAAAFPGQKVDPRTVKGRAVRRFASAHNIEARPDSVYVPVEAPVLTPENKEYISNSYKTMKTMEMARALFPDVTLTPLSIEVRTVRAYVEELDPKLAYENFEKTTYAEYKSPKTLMEVVARVNKFANTSLDAKTLNPKQQKDMAAQIGYLQTHRYIHQIESYDKENDRRLFESSFVRWTYDKNDLLEEEVDQYIILASEVVIAFNIQVHINMLTGLLDTTVKNEDRISMPLVEAISTARNEYNQSINRQDTLFKNLVEKRANRLKATQKDNASVSSLIMFWRNEERRRHIIDIANQRKKQNMEEADRLKTIDDLIFQCYGVDLSELANA